MGIPGKTSKYWKNIKKFKILGKTNEINWNQVKKKHIQWDKGIKRALRAKRAWNKKIYPKGYIIAYFNWKLQQLYLIGYN